jgi:hypothetical protein
MGPQTVLSYPILSYPIFSTVSLQTLLALVSARTHEKTAVNLHSVSP